MSPMGTLVLGTNSKPPEKVSPGLSSSTSLPAITNDHTLNNNNNDHPLLKLMSVSLLNENSLTLNLHHGLALTLGKNSRAGKSMKENEHNQNGICRPADSTSHDEYKKRRIRSTDEDESDRSVSPSLESQNSRRSGTPETNLEVHNHHRRGHGQNSDDEDEVLSIGRDDDQGMVIDCDSSTALSDCDESRIDADVRERKRRASDIDHEMRSESGSGGERTPNSSPCSSSASASNVTMFSPSATSYSDFHVHQHHKDILRHNYSATQPHSHVNRLQAPIGSHASLPFSITDAIMMKHQHRQQNLHEHLQHQQNLHQQQQSFQQQQASLLFSIANILRPDFGLGGSHSQLPSRPHLKSSSLKSRHSAPVSASAKRSSSSSAGSKPVRTHGLNPIDLSRPSLSLVKNHGSKIKQNGSVINNNNTNNHHSHKSLEANLSNPHQKYNSSSSKKSHKSSVLPLPPITNANANAKAVRAASSTTPTSSTGSGSGESTTAAPAPADPSNPWPAWVYCTRYSDRPSSGPRTRRSRSAKKEKEIDEKRPRTAFTSEQLARLKREFDENRYLTEKRRQDLARELRLHENQIKIWFQNKRAKLKKSTGQRGGLALQLMAQGLYNHSTIPARGDGDDDDDYDSD